MKPFLLIALLTLAACTEPTLHAGIAVGTFGVSVKPALSGNVGGATIIIEPN
ncbi:hypothetical protein [Tabrizicola sp.]|uniref:hypothetical protein n=1 Tax=Tabrizicola sp. TaxID=2005166 RepID=UPI003F30C3D6